MNVLVAVDVKLYHPAMPTSKKTTAETVVRIAVTPKCSLGVQKIAFQKD